MPAHLTPESLKFLRGLARNNDREWFEARRPVYEQRIKAPLHALIEEINVDLAEFAPDFLRPAHKIAMRIFRDTRFSPDKRPYKTNIAAWWARQGLEKTSAPGFFLQIGAEGGFAAGGIYAPEREDLLKVRQWMAEHHERFQATLAPLTRSKGKQAAMQLIAPNALTRNPKGFPADHSASDLLRARNWGVMVPLSTEQALDAGLGKHVTAQFRRIAPLIELMTEPFQSRARETDKHWF